MSPAIGQLIDADTDIGSKSGTQSDSGRFDGSQNSGRRIIETPQIIAGIDSFEPETVRIGTADSGTGARRTKSGKLDKRTKAGRTVGASDTVQKEVPDSLVDLTKLLLSWHEMGAAMLSIEELQLTEDEAQSLSDGIKEVAKYYPTHIDPKKIAVVNLIGVAGAIYAPRVFAYRKRVKTERASRPQLVRPAGTSPVQPSSQNITQSGGKTFVNGKPINEMSPSELWNQAPTESQGGF